jgi:hypothetical protein
MGFEQATWPLRSSDIRKKFVPTSLMIMFPVQTPFVKLPVFVGEYETDNAAGFA